jgi:hypothetical protein
MATAVAVVGAGISAAGTIAGGMAQQRAANYEAAQLDARAEEEKAAAQREATGLRRERDAVQGRQTAYNAASGFSASDETSQRLAGEVAQQGSYRALMAQYGGDERARGARAQASAARESGRAAMTGALFGAAGTMLGAMSKTSMFDRFAQGGPPGVAGAPMNLLPYPNYGSLY